MKKFKIYSKQFVYSVAEIEAEDEEQACEMASKDNCTWKELKYDWQIESTQEITA